MRLASRFVLLMLRGLGFGTAASAAPVLQCRIFKDDTLQAGLTGSTASGKLFVNGFIGNFAVATAVAVGAPLLASPSLSAQTTNTPSLTRFSAPSPTIRVEISRTGVESQSAGGLLASLASMLTANILVKDGLVTGVTIANHADTGDVALARGIQPASQTCDSPAGVPAPGHRR